MSQFRQNLFILTLICFLSLSGCKAQKSNQSKASEPPSSAKVVSAVPARDPQLISTPRTMDMIASQNNPAAVLADAAVSQNDDFFIKPVEEGTPPVERSDAKFARVIQVGGKQLELTGTAVRKFEMSAISLLTIYTVAFYAPHGEDFSVELPDVDQALILQYHMDVPKEKVVQAIKDNVYSNPKVKAEAVEKYFIQLSDAFDNPKKGDRYDFTYIRGRGTAMMKEGKILTVIPSYDFARAFFGIWVSPHGTDLQMRCELLNLPCPEKSKLNPVNLISSNLGGAKEKLGKLKRLIP